jgi:hypothetical protein
MLQFFSHSPLSRQSVPAMSCSKFRDIPVGADQMMGGDVTVTSEPGKGSVFTVRLPGGADTLRC